MRPPMKKGLRMTTSQCMYSCGCLKTCYATYRTMWNWAHCALGAFSYFCFNLKILMLNTTQVLIGWTVKKIQHINVIFLKVLVLKSLLTHNFCKTSQQASKKSVFFWFGSSFSWNLSTCTATVAGWTRWKLDAVRDAHQLRWRLLDLCSHTPASRDQLVMAVQPLIGIRCAAEGAHRKHCAKVPGMKTLPFFLSLLLTESPLRPKWTCHNTFYYSNLDFFFLFSPSTAVGEGRKKKNRNKRSSSVLPILVSYLPATEFYYFS